MEVQVENNVKNKRTNKQRKEKKKKNICTDWIQSMKNCGSGENIGKK